MGNWMTIQELGQYLQIPESKINLLIRNRAIPVHERLGSPRFYQTEIDEWMRTPAVEDQSPFPGEDTLVYRGKPIKHYTLAASKILCGKLSWGRLPDFINRIIAKVDEVDRPYLFKDDFEATITNSFDYVRLCFQIGLIDKEREGQRVHYYPTEYSRRINAENDPESIRLIILESILNIVKDNIETIPAERHAIMLLWYFLKLKEREEEPAESHFNKGDESTYYPRYRLMFSRYFCNFLFGEDESEEMSFLKTWDRIINASD